MWPFHKTVTTEDAWVEDSVISPLLRHDTLPFGKLPSVDMFKLQRLYAVNDELVPRSLSTESLRWMANLMFEKTASVFVERKTGEVFITTKTVEQIENFKSVALDSAIVSIKTAPFLNAFCGFLLNELLPNMTLEGARELPFSVLCDFDTLLSVRIRSNTSLKFVNFRNLAFRLSTADCSAEELRKLESDKFEKYKILVETFQQKTS